MSNLIAVNEDRCTSCGLCVRVCPVDVLEMQDNKPAVKNENCVACGHCTAVCPNEAIDNRLAPLSELPPRNKELDISYEQAVEFMRSRRSIRWFHNRPVEKEDLEKVLNMGRYAMSGANSQGVSYFVIEDKEKLQKISEVCADFIVIMSSVEGEAAAEFTKKRLKESSYDKVLFDAPALVILMTDKRNVMGGRDSSVMAMVYAQLFAPVVGLGTCWSGIVEVALTAQYQPLLDLLDIPENMDPNGAMMIGYPHYGFKRLTERAPLQIMWGN